MNIIYIYYEYFFEIYSYTPLNIYTNPNKTSIS